MLPSRIFRLRKNLSCATSIVSRLAVLERGSTMTPFSASNKSRDFHANLCHTSKNSTSMDPTSNKLPTRELAPGFHICPIVNGLWQTAGGHGQIDLNKAKIQMKKLHEAGFTSFDGADHYGPAEVLMGDLLTSLPSPTDSTVQLFTKWCPSPGRMTREVVNAAINRSLTRMQTKTIQVLQFHWWDYEDSEYLTALKHMKSLQDEGKIKHLALTNFNTEYLQNIISAGIPIVSNQVSYSIVDQRPAQAMVPLCEKHGIKLLTYGTLLGGLLSDKYYKKTEPRSSELNTSSLKKYKRFIDAWGPWSLFQELLEVCHQIGAKHNVSIANVATRYILDKPAVAGVIVGCRLGISEHIEDSKKVFSFSLSPEDTKRIDEVAKKGRVLPGDCGDEYRG